MKVNKMIKEIIYVLMIFSPSFLKTRVYRLLGAKIGRHTKISMFSYLKAEEIEMADFSSIGAFTIIRCNGILKIGEYSEISSFVLIYGESGLRMDKNCYIGPRAVINVTKDIRLGSVSAIGPCSILYTHGTWLPYNEGYPRKFKEIIIEDYVWISASVKIVPGIHIGRNSFINTGSVVYNDIPANVFAEGFPAKEVYKMDEIKRPITSGKLDRLIREMMDDFILEVLEKTYKLSVLKNDGRFECQYRGKNYTFILFDSSGINELTEFELNRKNKNFVILMNREKFQDKKLNHYTNVYIFDFIRMNVPFSKDTLHRELWVFFRRFYGVKFDYTNYLATNSK